MKQIVASALLAISLLAGGPAKAQDVDAIQKGRAIANQICSECHAVHKGEPRSPNGLAPSFNELARTPGMTTMALSAALQTSHRFMPNIILAGDERQNIIAYIMSLQ